MNTEVMIRIEDILFRQPKSVARRVLETYGDDAEKEIYRVLPDGAVRKVLLDTVKLVRSQIETREWNNSN